MSAQRLTAFFNGWRELTRAIEFALVDNLAATAPWLAPVIPAYLAWRNMTNVLQFPAWVALIGAIVVETLGLSTVHTVFSLWDYNDARRKSDQRAPVWIAIITAGMYITIVMVVNVLLEERPMVEMIAQALLSLLSVVAAITLAVRANHARRLADIRIEREERKAERMAAHPSAPIRIDAPHTIRIVSYTCDKCGDVFPSQQKMAAHKRWQHANGNGHTPPPETVSDADAWLKSVSNLPNSEKRPANGQNGTLY